MQGKLRGIEIMGYSYGRWFFSIACSKFKPPWQGKKAASSLKFVVERRFNFALCDVRLSLRHLDQVTRTMSLRINSCFATHSRGLNWKATTQRMKLKFHCCTRNDSLIAETLSEDHN